MGILGKCARKDVSFSRRGGKGERANFWVLEGLWERTPTNIRSKVKKKEGKLAFKAADRRETK